MNPLKNSIQQRAQKKFRGSKDFYEKNLVLYLMSWAFGIAALVISGITTYQYFVNSLGTFETPLYNSILAFTFAASQSLLLGYLATRITQDLFRNEWYWLTTVLTLFFLSLSSWNLYTDFVGSKDLATAVTTKPIDIRTEQTNSTFDKQIAAAQKEKQDIQDRIAYIKTGCKKDDCFVTGGKAYYKGVRTPFGKKEIRRLEAQKEAKSTKISELQSSFTKERETSTTLFADNLTDWEDKRDRRTNNFRGLVLIALIFLILSSLYKEYFESMVEKEVRNVGGGGSGADDPGPGRRISREQYLENQLQMILQERGFNTPYPSTNGHPAANVRPMHADNTGRVAHDTGRVIQGQGFNYDCTYCDEPYMAKREIPQHHKPFCCNDHRTRYWSEKNKEKRKQE